VVAFLDNCGKKRSFKKRKSVVSWAWGGSILYLNFFVFIILVRVTKRRAGGTLRAGKGRKILLCTLKIHFIYELCGGWEVGQGSSRWMRGIVKNFFNVLLAVVIHYHFFVIRFFLVLLVREARAQ
jgi:hypothetical protein